LNLLHPSSWKDYELLDSGNFEKLERFGKVMLIRPEPQAIWEPVLSDAEWKKQAHAHFTREQKDNFRYGEEVKGVGKS
jgi:23S rRNA (cytosine1962-C5)-methyltransferase